MPFNTHIHTHAHIRTYALAPSGELVLERHVGQYGARARGWPAPALEALRRRHEWLLGAIAAAVCAVPRELFLPLGPRSRRLLYPSERGAGRWSGPGGMGATGGGEG